MYSSRNPVKRVISESFSFSRTYHHMAAEVYAGVMLNLFTHSANSSSKNEMQNISSALSICAAFFCFHVCLRTNTGRDVFALLQTFRNKCDSYVSLCVSRINQHTRTHIQSNLHSKYVIVILFGKRFSKREKC